MHGVSITQMFGKGEGQEDGWLGYPTFSNLPPAPTDYRFCTICLSPILTRYLYRTRSNGDMVRVCMDCMATAIGGKPCRA